MQPIQNVDRFSRSEKKEVPITRPHAVLQYNKNLGASDLMYGSKEKLVFCAIELWQLCYNFLNVCYRFAFG